MGKPRLIILIRHAQSEGNKNKAVHQTVPDHRVGLTPEGHEQARAAGEKLRALLRSDDTLHFFISPYKRTRETTEGILSNLCADEPAPSPFRRSQIKVYEEPRLREQDFGNFQPGTEEVERLWRERAQYGHFFYRIPNGESGSDVHDRISGFVDSLWRRISEPEMASVAIIVSHGVSIRCFLMRWYHFSVEYFEDLRNINHVEFIVMRLKDNGRYALQNTLRTWSELKRERAARGSISAGSGNAPPVSSPVSSIPTRRRWGDCPDGCTNPEHNHSKRMPVRRNTADLFKDDSELVSSTPRPLSSSPLAHRDFAIEEESATPHRRGESFENGEQTDSKAENSDPTVDQSSPSQAPQKTHSRSRTFLNRGRDGGGSKSGAPSPFSSEEEDEPLEESEPPFPGSDARGRNNTQPPKLTPVFFRPSSLAKALRGELGGPGQILADALGDQSDAEVEEADMEMGDQARQKDEEERILADERRDRSRNRDKY